LEMHAVGRIPQGIERVGSLGIGEGGGEVAGGDSFGLGDVGDDGVGIVEVGPGCEAGFGAWTGSGMGRVY